MIMFTNTTEVFTIVESNQITIHQFQQKIYFYRKDRALHLNYTARMHFCPVKYTTLKGCFFRLNIINRQSKCEKQFL